MYLNLIDFFTKGLRHEQTHY